MSLALASVLATRASGQVIASGHTDNNGGPGGAQVVQIATNGSLQVLGGIFNSENRSSLNDAGSILVTNGGILNNFNDYLDSHGILQPGTSLGASTVTVAVAGNFTLGDVNGSGQVLNGLADEAAPYFLHVDPTLPAGGGTMDNLGNIAVQNGSDLENGAGNSIFVNAGGGVVTVYGGYLDANGNDHRNSTGGKSAFQNEASATLFNGDAAGAADFINGAYRTSLSSRDFATDPDGALLLNNHALIENQNGSLLYNLGPGAVFINTNAGTVINTDGYAEGQGYYHPGTSGENSVIENGFGGVLDNGDGSGDGQILNAATLVNFSALLNNQNGASVSNLGTGSIISNSGNGIIANYSGYVDASGVYQHNSTGGVSTIYNSSGSVIYNGDTGSVGIIVNGAASGSVTFTLGPTPAPFAPPTPQNDGAMLSNDGSYLANVNGSQLINIGAGSIIANDSAGLIANFSGAIEDGHYEANSTRLVSTIENLDGAVIDNGGEGGAAEILNGAAPQSNLFSPGAQAASRNDGAILLNSGSLIANQNGSLLENVGRGSVITNTASGVIANYDGYLDPSIGYHANTSSLTSTIQIESSAELDNGDATGAGEILNGATPGAALFAPGAAFSARGDGALIDVNGGTLINQNGSLVENVGAGSVIKIDGKGTLDNLNGYLGAGNSVMNNNTGWTSTLRNEQGAVIDVGGAGSVGGGTLNNELGGQLYNAATINLVSGSVLNNTGAGTTFTNDVGGVVNNGGQFTNSGTFVDTGSVLGQGNYNQTGGSMTVSGTFTQNEVDLRAGTVTIQTGGAVDVSLYNQHAGSTVVFSGGTLDPTAIEIGGGTFGGSGDLIGNINNSGGELILGDSFASPGTLSETGNYVQAAGGELFVGIDSETDNGLFDIEGGAILAGTLDIDLLDGFTPQDHEIFTIMTLTGGHETGAFTSIIGSDAADWTVLYNGTNVELESNLALPNSVSEDESTLWLAGAALAALFAASRGKLRAIPAP